MRELPKPAAQSAGNRAWSLSTLPLFPRRLTLSRSSGSEHLAPSCAGNAKLSVQSADKSPPEPWHPRCTSTGHGRARIHPAYPDRAGRPPVHRATRHGNRCRHRNLRLVLGSLTGRTRARKTRRSELNDPAGCRGAAGGQYRPRQTPWDAARRVRPRAPACAGACCRAFGAPRGR